MIKNDNKIKSHGIIHIRHLKIQLLKFKLYNLASKPATVVVEG